jgi:hypothetical protein
MADKFEAEGTNPNDAFTLRFLAESNIAQAKAARRKSLKTRNRQRQLNS